MSDTPKAFIRSLLSVEEVEAIIAERDAARAHVERLTAALEIVANHPEKSEPSANPSYSMGWVFYRIRDVARAALAAERSRPAAHTQRE